MTPRPVTKLKKKRGKKLKMNLKEQKSADKFKSNLSLTRSKIRQSAIYNRRVSSKEITELKKEATTDVHKIDLKVLFKRLGSNPATGLNEEQYTAYLERDGLNRLTPPKQTPECVKFLQQFTNGFSIVLWLCSLLCFASWLIESYTSEDPTLNNLVISILIAIVIIVTGVFSYLQNRSSSKIMESFQKMVPSMATVLRDGQVQVVDAIELVKGDIVFIKSGDKVPADLRILESSGLKVDNSSLTGETEPQSRGTAMTHINPMETKNLAFFSTSVMEGSGKGIVFQTGDETVIGRLAGLTSGLARNESTMAREIQHFCHIILFVAIFVTMIIFIVALSIGVQIIDSVIYCLAIMVANVPEALLMTVTLCLTLSAKKMAKKNCLIKRLESVETLGSTSTICSDKTGTLTQNRMTVTDIVYSFKIFPVKYSEDKSGTVDDEFDRSNSDFQLLIRCGTLCLRAMFDDDAKGKSVLERNVDGDASEAAILKCMECITKNTKETRNTNSKLAEIPFNSTNKYQLSIHNVQNKHVLVMKGAPEKIISLCSTIRLDGGDKPLKPEHQKTFESIYTELGNRGQRVLGFCDLDLGPAVKKVYNTEEPNFPTKNLRFLGLMALIDPPRPSVPGAVAKCKIAGIRVIMVTGDHPITAEAIAREVGIISANSETRKQVAQRLRIKEEAVSLGDVKAIVVTGDELRTMTNDELDEILKYHPDIVFSRTTPTQKLNIVEGCQRLGYITAVTGDGVNDSPALKKADIGIAMGITGSDVSKQAADMILLDDNFSSIVTGVEEGRLIFDNLKKSIAYTLTSNIPEMAPFIAYMILGVPMPLGIIAIIAVDIGTNLLPAISLAHEKPESDIMERPPRNPFKDQLVNRRLIWMTYGQIGFIQTLAGFASYFFLMADFGFLPRTLFGIRIDWYDSSIDNLEDSFGQEWTYTARRELEKKAQCAYFAAIVTTQVFDLLICKTRRNSIFQQGMGNHVLNLAIFVTIGIACFFIYTPVISDWLGFPGISFVHWLPAIPFGMLIVVFDEVRRLIMRHNPGGWVERETYY